MKLAANHKLVWFPESINAGAPDLNEVDFVGTLDAAVAQMATRATEGNFLLGQVLRDDGFVLATVAKGGHTHLTPLQA